MAKYESHDFYCINCGNKGLPVFRNNGRLHSSFHRKKLWCCHCKTECNHIEIRNQEEKEQFMEAFNNEKSFWKQCKSGRSKRKYLSCAGLRARVNLLGLSSR